MNALSARYDNKGLSVTISSPHLRGTRAHLRSLNNVVYIFKFYACSLFDHHLSYELQIKFPYAIDSYQKSQWIRFERRGSNSCQILY